MQPKSLWTIAIVVLIAYEVLNYSFFTNYTGDFELSLYVTDIVAGIATTLFFALLLSLPIASIPYQQWAYKRKLSVLFPLTTILILGYLAAMIIMRQV